jgi:uncharacterized damage-inducible protein DinB
MAADHDAAATHPAPEAPPQLRVPRPEEATPADEMTMARGWLTHLRESAIFKLEGLDNEQMRWTPAPTANSLGAIVMHLGYAERLWLRVIFNGETMDMSWRQHMFDVPPAWSADDVVRFYRVETTAADGVLDEAGSMDLPSAAEIRPTTLRWIVTHLVEEIARHVGHMDITRELLDGSTGR